MPSKSKITTKIFIERAKQIHAEKYDYSKVHYINSYTKVIIICPVHGEFKMLPCNHIGPQRNECKPCALQKRNKNLSYSNENIITIIRDLYGDRYDLSKVQYAGYNRKITLICSKHGEFSTTPHSLFNTTHGCAQCGRTIRRSDKEEFIKKANKIHDGKYDYTKTIYLNSRTPIIITCSKHGDFKQKPKSHIGDKRGCPSCYCSINEKNIREWLMENNIEFIEQHKFPDCKYKNVLKFDFYLLNKNTLIEFQGEQHYHFIKGMHRKIENFEIGQLRDKIKRDYCKNKGITLIEIPYDADYKEILSKSLM